MQFDGAVIKEQGVTFAIAVVKSSAFNTQQSKQETMGAFNPYFPGMPLVLMCQDSRGIPRYYGRNDIVKFLSNIDPRRIPFKRYTFN